MNPTYLASVIAIACTVAGAQEIGHVLSSTPVIQQVTLPQQVCTQESITTPGAAHGGGAVIGAIAGAAVYGAVQQVQRCTTLTSYENRVTYYDVVYEYRGNSYAVQMPSDPGPTVQLQVTPIGATQGITPQPAPTGTYRTPVITSYETIVTSQPYVASSSSVFIALPVYPYAMNPQHRQRPYAGNHRPHRPHRHDTAPYPRHGSQPYWR